MKYALILSVFVMSISGNVRAQSWDAAPDTTPLEPADVAQLPYSATFDWISPTTGWHVPSGATWTPVWPRNAAGAWYRNNQYTQITATKNKVYQWPYTCQVQGMGFRCLDKIRNIWRTVSCPSYLFMGPLKLWRSAAQTPGWPAQNLFRGTTGPFWATTGRQINLTSVVVTNSGQNLNCQFGNITSAGPGLTTDVWIFRR